MVCSLGKTRSKEKIGGGSEDMIKKKKLNIYLRASGLKIIKN